MPDAQEFPNRVRHHALPRKVPLASNCTRVQLFRRRSIPALALLAWAGPAGAASPAPPVPLTLATAVREAIESSPEVRRAQEEWRLASLEEPLLLANTDPVLGLKAQAANDRAPRASPAFQGSYADSRGLDLTMNQKWLVGTEAKAFFATQRMDNPAGFRPLNPTIDSRLGLEVRQPLLRYFWGRPDIARRRRARAGVAVTQGRLRRLQDAAAARAAQAYLEASVARETLTIREAGVGDAQKLLQSHREKRRYGLVEESDILQAEASLRAQETEAAIARSALAQADNALRSALWRDTEEPFDAPLARPAAPQRPLPDRREILRQAWERRGDYQAAQAAAERAEWHLRAQTLETLPELSLFGSYVGAGLDGSASRSWGDAGSFDQRVVTGGLQFEFAFGRKREKLRREEARLQAAAAKAEADALRASIRREVFDGVERLSLARERSRAYGELLSIERRKLASAEEDFRRGRASTDLVIRFQGDIRRAESQALRASADEIGGWAELALAAGRAQDELMTLGEAP